MKEYCMQPIREPADGVVLVNILDEHIARQAKDGYRLHSIVMYPSPYGSSRELGVVVLEREIAHGHQ